MQHLRPLNAQVNGHTGFLGKEELVDSGASTLDTPQSCSASEESWVTIYSPSSVTQSPLPALSPVGAQGAAPPGTREAAQNRCFICLSQFYLAEISSAASWPDALQAGSGCQGKQTLLPRSRLTTCCCCLNSIKIRGSVGRDTAALLLMQCQAGWELSIKSN